MSFVGHHAIRIVTYLCNVTGIPSWSSGELCKHNDYGQMDRTKCLRTTHNSYPLSSFVPSEKRRILNFQLHLYLKKTISQTIDHNS